MDNGFVVIMAVFIIGIASMVWIDSRPNSYSNMLAKEIAEAIKEAKKSK
jgi:hypothetical protein